jgi:hypothetical protein
MAFVGMQDQYATSGRWDQLLKHFGLTPERIAEAARGVAEGSLAEPIPPTAVGDRAR